MLQRNIRPLSHLYALDINDYRLDVIGFANDVLGVELHPGQVRILSGAFPKGVEPEDWQYKYFHISTGNRFGKSVLMAILHLWFAFFKHRCPAEYGTEDWFLYPYAVANICPLNDIAYVVREKVGLILQDKAKEQLMRPGGRGYCEPSFKALFKQAKKGEVDKSGNPFLVSIPDSEYKGFITEHNVHLEYRTADDHAKALQGRVKYLVTFDEAGRHKDPVTLLASDIAPRTIDSRGVIVTATTPHLESESNYEELWQTGNPENPDRARFSISFEGSMEENPHVTEQMIEEALDGQPDYLRDQIVGGKFIQSAEAFFNAKSINEAAVNLPNKRRRIKGHLYIIGWDLAIAKDGDRSIGAVVDVSETPCKLVEYMELPKGTQHPQIVLEMYKQLAFYHNDKAGTKALMTYDATGMAGLMFKHELRVLYPKPIGIDYAGTIKKKLNMLQSLRMMLSKKRLIFPKECVRLKYELKHYKRKDMKLETDAVMALALVARLVERTKGRLGKDKAIIKGSLTP